MTPTTLAASIGTKNTYASLQGMLLVVKVWASEQAYTAAEILAASATLWKFSILWCNDTA